MLRASLLKRISGGGMLCIFTLILPSPTLGLLPAQQVASPGRPAPPGTVFQSPQPGDTPGVDSPGVYRSFFTYHHQLSNWIESQAPTDAAKAKQDAAKLHRIQQDEYPRVAAISHSVVADLKHIDTVARDHIRAAKSRGAAPDLNVLQQSERDRQRTLSDAITRLQSSLSPESWKGLHDYLNDEHRKHIHAVTAQKQ